MVSFVDHSAPLCDLFYKDHNSCNIDKVFFKTHLEKLTEDNACLYLLLLSSVSYEAKE